VVIQITKTKSVDWTPPWEKRFSQESDIVGIELESGCAEGCPAVRLQRHKGALCVAAVGFVPPPKAPLATNWDDLDNIPHWSIPSALRAKKAALALNSSSAFTRQTAAAPFLEDSSNLEGKPASRDDVRTTFRKMADESSVLLAALPEYQALWAGNLLVEESRPVVTSLQTAPCALLSSLSAQPGFCDSGEEAAVFVANNAIYLAGFREGIPLLFRECTGVAGVTAIRSTVQETLGLDDAMLETVLTNDGIIDTRPALTPLLVPVVSQIEISLDYLKSRLGASINRLFLMGDPIGCAAMRQIFEGRLSLPIETPGAFNGLELPNKLASWKNLYCMGDTSQRFLAALGAALAIMKEES